MTEREMKSTRRILIIDGNRSIHDDFRRILNTGTEPQGQACGPLREPVTGLAPGAPTASAPAFRREREGDGLSRPRRCPEPSVPNPSPGEERGAYHAGGSNVLEVDSAYQCEEALAMIQKAAAQGRPYAAAFVDVGVPPDWHGIETVERLWKEYPDVAVVLCTACSNDDLDDIFARLGATDPPERERSQWGRPLILKKPFDSMEVRQLAHTLTDKWNKAHGIRGELAERGLVCGIDSRIPIVVVDDDTDTVALLKKILETSGYEVQGFTDSAEAWDFLRASGPLILLSDWRMPGLSGVELCRRIRSSDHVGKIYTILMTASTDPQDVSVGLEAGADDYVTKPCHRTELLARIHAGERVLRLLRQLRDCVTDTAAQNQALEAANARAEQAMEQLQQTQRQLQQADKMASIGQLAAGVAHEINNPIGFISSNLNSLGQYVEDIKCILALNDEMLQACRNHPELAQTIEKFLRVWEEKDIDYVLSDLGNLIGESVEGANRVRQIVADLRDFSHVDNPDVAEEDVNELLDKTINVAWNELKYKTEVVREYGEIPAIPCYGGKLGQVFLNLLVNAAQAIEEHGTITVRTGQQDGHIWIEVVDTGCGIKKENLNRIFDPFFTTKEVGKGTGLGLNLAYNIVRAHGGQINAESVVGEGTTFRIELPISGPPVTKEKRGESVAC